MRTLPCEMCGEEIPIAMLPGHLCNPNKGIDMDKSGDKDSQLRQWLRDNAPDCGDNSCLFGGKGKGGMRTNGGCRCYKDVRPDMRRIYIERMQAALSSCPPISLAKNHAEMATWLDSNMTFFDVVPDGPEASTAGPNIPVLASVSKRIWYHATDNQTDFPFSSVIATAMKSAVPESEAHWVVGPMASPPEGMEFPARSAPAAPSEGPTPRVDAAEREGNKAMSLLGNLRIVLERARQIERELAEARRALDASEATVRSTDAQNAIKYALSSCPPMLPQPDGWVRYKDNGASHYIEGAEQPNHVVYGTNWIPLYRAPRSPTPDIENTITTVQAPNGGPVAAPCAISGCALMSGEAVQAGSSATRSTYRCGTCGVECLEAVSAIPPIREG